MNNNEGLKGVNVMFIAGFGPIPRQGNTSHRFYQQQLGLPLNAMPDNERYLHCEHDALPGVKHFALWPLDQAAHSCFGNADWPKAYPVPQVWIEFEVVSVNEATQRRVAQGYPLLVNCRLESWGQTVSRLLSPEGLLVGVTYTPWMREAENADAFIA